MPDVNSKSSQESKSEYGFLTTQGEMSRLIRQYDWATTPLGAINEWPQSLRTAVNILLQSTVPIVMLWGTDGIMIYNDAYSIFAGARHPQLLGSKVLQGWPEVADFNAHVMNVVLKGKTLSYTNQQLVLYRNNTAEDVWMNLNYSPVMDETDKPAGVFAIVVETTEKIQAEQKLATTRAQLESALAVGSISTWWWDLERDVLIGDTNMAKAFGVDPKKAAEGLSHKVFIDSIHPDDKQLVLDAINETIKTTNDYEIEYRTINADKKPIWVIARGQIQKDSDGNPTHLVGILIDITERKIAHQELEDAKRMFDALFDSTIMAIAMADTEGNILKANKTFLKLFGYTRAEFNKGLTSAQLTAKSQVHVTENIYKSIKETGETEPVEKIYVRKDGTEFPALVGAARLPHSDNSFMAFIVDISENQRLKDLNKIKDEFIALASHQLRTPATTVKQYLGILEQGMAGPLNPEQLKFMSIANKANDRQLHIINDLLKTAQIDSRGYSLNLIPKNLVTISKDVLGQYETVMASRHQKVNFTSAKDTVIVPVDEHELAICFANLIENASKYSPEGSTINFSIKQHKSYVEITVTDHGVGIEQKNYDKIFDKFTRVDNELSDTVNGNGLGLYWVKRIVNSHKGTIKVASDLGKGTSFIVRLPT